MEDSPPVGCCFFFLYEAAVIFAVIRWVLSWATRDPPRSPSSSPRLSPSNIRLNLPLLNYADVISRHNHRHGRSDSPADADVCAVCLSQLRPSDEVREMRNCSHVFHRRCIDRWIDRDRSSTVDVDDDDDDINVSNRMACPLCRAPLLTQSQLVDRLVKPDPESNWAMERILYIFGDDLIC